MDALMYIVGILLLLLILRAWMRSEKRAANKHLGRYFPGGKIYKDVD